MEITVSHEQGRVAIAVIKLTGQLDGQTYQSLIDKAYETYTGGVHDFLLDLSELTYISSAGLVSLHTIALIVRGEVMPDAKSGWNSLKSMDKTRDGGLQQHIKLFAPRPEVMNVLELVGFSSFFEVFTDKQAAVDSF